MEPGNQSEPTIEEQYANVRIEDEEEDSLIYVGDADDLTEIDDRWCLVGRFLTNKGVDFQAMQNKMATLWQPGRGMYVKELDSNLFLFQFYHEVDIDRVIEGSPWTFDRVPLIFERLKQGEDPRMITLNKLDFWVQIHNLTTGFMLERVVRDLGNYVGTFIKTDPNNFIGVWRDYLRVRVKINIECPLKRRKKVEKQGGVHCYANFKYEGLSTFCFIGGILGHSERFCEQLFHTPLDQIQKPYTLELKATPRRKNYAIGERWLRSGAASRVGGMAFSDHATTGERSTPINGNQTINNHGRQSRLNHIPPNNLGSSSNQSINERGNSNMMANSLPQLKEGGAIIDQPSMKETIVGDTALKSNMINKETSILILDTKRRRTDIVNGLGLDNNLDNNTHVEVTNEEFGDVGPIQGPPGIMNVLSWNCRGLGNQRAIQFLKEIVSQKNPNFIFLCETKCDKKRIESMGRMLKFEGVFGVEAQGSSGGLALLWKNKDDGHVLGYSNNHIDFLVESSEKGAWKLTGFYGEPERNNRHRSWTLLRTLATDSTLPWCVIGDLNNIVRHEDKRGGRPYPQRLIDGFQQALNDCNLIDMELVGHPFTWEKGRGSRNWIEVRLDRALINDAWSQIFQGASLINLEISSSDHCPIFLEPEINHCFPTNRKFKFENAWLKEPMCFEIVRDCWESEGDDNLPNKLARCADKLSIWGKEVTGNFKARITRCKNEIKRLANKRDTASIQRHKEVKEELFHVLDQRESFWKQRSKQLWLKEGDHNSSTRWCVFDGEEINVLKEPWLPSEDDPYVHSHHPSLGEAKVRNLMVMEGGSWDVDILNDLFIERDKKLILDIPLNISHGNDKLTWSYESSGIYSVKSGYNLLQKIHGRWDGNEDDLTKFWTKFWKQKIPPKVKNLVWRAARECLPTLQQLKIKRVDVQTSCPVCHSEDESVIHALITCTKVKQVWDRVGIGITTAAAEPENFLDWFVAAFTAAEAEKKLLLPVLCWAIWSARNDVVWQKKSVTAASIVVLATGYLEQWKNAQNSRIETSWSGLKADDGAEHWTVPSIDHIKVNVDAALFDSGNKYGCGLVARDHHGMLIEGKTKLFTGSVSPEVAESIGIREALSWIKRHNWQHVTLETDCLTVVQAIRSEVKMISMFGQIIQECKNLLLELKTISMLFVKRSANMVAHNCARASIFVPGCIFDMESVPSDHI
uniref:Reverse transcriptase n=1 Tax=Cannabis sativa TaxID=3483 RepID=A0A803QI56_CANSA